MGIMTAPVVGSGSWPACTQRVANANWFGRLMPGTIKSSENAYEERSSTDPEIIYEVKTCRHSEEAIALHYDGHVVLAKQRHELGNGGVSRNGFRVASP